MEENVELLQRAVDAYNARDLAALAELSTEDFEFAPYLTTLIESTTYHGQEGWASYFDDADAAWKALQVRLDEAREPADGVLYGSGEIAGVGRASGLEIRIPLYWVVRLRDGKISRMEAFESGAAAREAAKRAGVGSA